MPKANELERKLQKACQDPKEEQTFRRALLNNEIYFLGEIEGQRDDEEGEVELSVDSAISVTHWFDDAGHEFVPFFTSLDAMAGHVEEGEHYLRLLCRTFMELTEGEFLFLNPDTEEERWFIPEDVKLLLAQQ